MSVWSGSFRLFGVDVKCHVLSNGQRIIEEDSMEELLRAMSDGDDLATNGDAREIERFARWRRGATDGRRAVRAVPVVCRCQRVAWGDVNECPLHPGQSGGGSAQPSAAFVWKGVNDDVAFGGLTLPGVSEWRGFERLKSYEEIRVDARRRFWFRRCCGARMWRVRLEYRDTRPLPRESRSRIDGYAYEQRAYCDVCGHSEWQRIGGMM